jgi:hypothetical protein
MVFDIKKIANEIAHPFAGVMAEVAEAIAESNKKLDRIIELLEQEIDSGTRDD